MMRSYLWMRDLVVDHVVDLTREGNICKVSHLRSSCQSSNQLARKFHGRHGISKHMTLSLFSRTIIIIINVKECINNKYVQCTDARYFIFKFIYLAHSRATLPKTSPIMNACILRASFITIARANLVPVSVAVCWLRFLGTKPDLSSRFVFVRACVSVIFVSHINMTLHRATNLFTVAWRNAPVVFIRKSAYHLNRPSMD